MNAASFGFGGNIKTKIELESSNNLHAVQPQDLIKFGLIPEFVGRLPVTVSLNSLNKEALVRILTEPKDALVKQYQKLFEIDGVELEIMPDAVEAVADKAIELDTGARGLRSIMENSMLDLMFATPTDKEIEKVVITGDTIRGGKPTVIKKSAPLRQEIA